MPLKALHCRVKLEHEPPFLNIPMPTKKVSQETIDQTFQQIQEETKRLVKIA